MKLNYIFIIIFSILFLTGSVFATDLFSVTITVPNPNYQSSVKIIADDIIDNSISTAKIQNLAVNSSKLANNSVITSKISNESITAEKIAATNAGGSYLKWESGGLVWAPASGGGGGTTYTATAPININASNDISLNDLGVTTGKLANNAVTLAKINASGAGANKYLKINSAGNALEWSDVSTEVNFDIQYVFSDTTIGVGDTIIWRVDCPVGYHLITGGVSYHSGGQNEFIGIQKSAPKWHDGGYNSWECSVRNNGAQDTMYRCSALCKMYN